MSELIFFNVWRSKSQGAQNLLLSKMREEATKLAVKQGFLGMTVWRARQDYRVLVRGRWASEAHFREAVSENAGALAARAEMDSLALAEPGVFEESLVIGGDADGAASEAFPLALVGQLRDEAHRRWEPFGTRTHVIGVDGVDLFVAEAGAGKPLLLLHGYPQSGEIWRLVVPELAKARRIIIPDLPGMGLSGFARDGYELPTVAACIMQLLNQLNVGDVDIVGHDWGAAVGATLALRSRSRASKLAFIEGALGGAGFENLWVFDKPNPPMTFIPLLLTEGLVDTLLQGREEDFLHHLWKVFTFNKARVPFEEWRRYVDAMRRPGVVASSASYYQAVYGGVNAIRKSISEQKLQIPVLSVSGSASLGIGQRALVDAFASNVTKHVTIENAGHFVAEEQPEKLLGALQSFLNE